MTTIIVTHEDDEVDEFEFEADKSPITIGRRSTNDVCVPNLSVSGKHAQITMDASGIWVEDLKSTNGTYINGRMITRQALNHEDEIIIGKTRVAYFQSAAEYDSATLSRGEQHDDSAYSVDDPRQQVNPARPAAAERPPIAEANAALSGRDVVSAQSIESDASSANDRLADSVVDEHEPMTLSDKAKAALGRTPTHNVEAARPVLKAVNTASMTTPIRNDGANSAPIKERQAAAEAPHPLDGVEAPVDQKPTHELDAPSASNSNGAVIEIKNGAKSGQILPIDKPVTTLGRPGIQIAAIMRKPDGYFLMHIESDDSVDRPTLNQDAIGDEPVLLHSGDELNVAGIDVEFMLS